MQGIVAPVSFRPWVSRPDMPALGYTLPKVCAAFRHLNQEAAHTGVSVCDPSTQERPF